MFCGTSSFGHVDPGDRDGGARSPSSAPSTPRGSRSRSKRGRETKNPYSTRGLDTFYAVLAELEARRQRILEKVGEKGSMIRFEYSDSQWVPIVVRIPTAVELAEEKKKWKKGRETKTDHHHHHQQQQDNNNDKKKPPERRPSSWSPPRPISPKSPQPVQSPPALTQPKQQGPTAVHTASSSTPAPRLQPLRCLSRTRCRTAYMGPPCQGVRPLLLLALILLCLAAFGRTFAICCTCAWWYLAPSPMPACMLESGGGRWSWAKNNNKAMDYGRRPSGKHLRTGSRVPEGPFVSPPKQRWGSGFMSPPKQRHSGLLSPPKDRLKSLLSPPKSRPAQVALPAKHRQSFNRRGGGSAQLD